MSPSVKQQYERFPYPPVGVLALPRRGQGEGLRYEQAFKLASGEAATDSHRDIRILVVGAGTLEALVVAQAHPKAKEIVALDISGRSLQRLRSRIRWARTRDAVYLAPLFGRGLPPVRLVQSDINQFSESSFDYIIASNVLHHTEDAAATLKHLASLLRTDGVMRVVTYPAMSRYWIRQTGAWFKLNGLEQNSPRLKKSANQLIRQLPTDHPVRSCFIGHSEATTTTGLVDAFFHACEKPLSPLQWQHASEAAGLTWLGETQSAVARGDFLIELMPQCAALTPWQRLQVLDDTLELNTNPVWWFRKSGQPLVSRSVVTESMGISNTLQCGVVVEQLEHYIDRPWRLPSETYWELGQTLRRADSVLQSVGGSVRELIALLRKEVGPRASARGKPLKHLTLGEFDLDHLFHAKQPLAQQHWQQLQSKLGDGAHLYHNGLRVKGADLHSQSCWLQLYYGALESDIASVELRVL